MKKRLRFNKPVITRIKLDPEQAVLAECLVNGAYYGSISLSAYSCLAVGTGRGTVICPIPKRGGSTTYAGAGTLSAAGS